MTLEPSLILFVEAPTLVLQALSSEVLLVSALTVVKDEEEGISVDALVQIVVIRNRRRLLGVVMGSIVFGSWAVVAWLLRVGNLRLIVVRGLEHILEGCGIDIGRSMGFGDLEAGDQILQV